MRLMILVLLTSLIQYACSGKSSDSPTERPNALQDGSTPTPDGDIDNTTVPEFILQVDFSTSSEQAQDFWFDWTEQGQQVTSSRRIFPVFDQTPLDVAIESCLEFDWRSNPHEESACRHQNQAMVFADRGPVDDSPINNVLSDGIIGRTHMAMELSPLPAGKYEMTMLFHDAALDTPVGEFEFFVDSPEGRSSLGIFTPSAGRSAEGLREVTFNFQQPVSGRIRIYIRCITSGFVINGFTTTKFFDGPSKQPQVFDLQCQSNERVKYEFLEPTLWTKRFSSDPGAQDFPGPLYSTTPRFIDDFNEAGQDDILFVAESGIYVSLGSWNHMSFPDRWLNGERGQFLNTNQSERPFTTGDVNGDGRPDLIAFGKDGTHAALNQGGSFADFVKLIDDFGIDQGWNNRSQSPRFVTDINGDGRVDLLGIKEDRIRIRTFTSDLRLDEQIGINEPGILTGSEFPKFIEDLDGDGVTDILSVGDQGVTVAFGVKEETVFEPFQLLSPAFSPVTGWGSQDYEPRLAGVFGRADAHLASLIGLQNGKFFAADNLSTTSQAKVIPELASFASSKAELQHYEFDLDPLVIGDMNADGIDDLVYFGYQGTYVSLSVKRCR